MGGKELKYAMLIDTARCSVCFACQVACKDEFVGNKYPPYSFPQPDVEQEWIKIEEIETGKFPYVKVHPIPVLCMHCDKAPCIDACPVKGSIYKENNGAVIIDPVKCDPWKCKTRPCKIGRAHV
jgi:tetrathionate reductase subunit B